MSETGTATSLDNREGARVTRIIRFNIDNRWLLSEMRDFLTYVENIYNLIFFFNIFNSDDLWMKKDETQLNEVDKYYKKTHFDRVAFLQRLPKILDSYYFNYTDYIVNPDFSKFVFPDDQLEVKKISYSSPGTYDLLGLAGIVKEIKELLLPIVESIINKKRRELENNSIRLNNEAQEIKNKQALVELRRLNLKERDKSENDRLRLECRKYELEIERTQIENKKLEAELEKAKIENEKHQIEVVEKFIKILDESNFNAEDKEAVSKWLYFQVDKIGSFAKDGKLTGISVLSR